MFCRRCGNKLDDGVKFCSKCGATVETQAVLSNVDNVNVRNSMQNNSKLIGKIAGVIFLLVGIITIIIFGMMEYDLYVSEWQDASDSYNAIFNQCVRYGYSGELSDILDVAREPLDEVENEMIVKGCIGGGFGLLCISVSIVLFVKSRNKKVKQK